MNNSTGIPVRRGPSYASADELRRHRFAAGWTQKDLAARSGVHVQTVKYWEGQEGRIGGHAVRLFREAFAAADIEDLAPLPKPASTRPAAERYLHDTGTLDHCGAKTRKGAPCRVRPLPGKGRCKFHGGMSTGPRTDEGRRRIAEAQARRWQAHKAAQSPLVAILGARLTERSAGGVI